MQPVFGSTHGQQISFMGPFGVGKTTAVRAVTQSEVVLTEATSTAASIMGGKHLKPTTTVGLEYGEWTAPDGTLVAVVGTPGQARFDAVRQSALPRSTAVVLWVFGHHAEALLDCELWVRFMLDEGVPTSKLAVAVTRLDDDSTLAVDDFAQVVAEHADAEVPVLAADPRSAEDVQQVLVASLRGALAAAADAVRTVS